MEFEPALVLELREIEGFSSKIFPLVATEGVPAPYIAYSSSEGLREKNLSGYTNSKEIEVDLNIIAGTYKEMKRLTALVIDKLISFESRVIGKEGPFVQELKYERPVELYEPLPKLHRCVIEFIVHI
ncbi:DUF3168 domain-containing protein [Paenibacillus sp. TAF43_2]|uniref:tail completion protein gp17 n=1 Tax=Paenibacillus sp. TAF43_2 TaxID=3233069 RepID=UPI003F9B3BD8